MKVTDPRKIVNQPIPDDNEPARGTITWFKCDDTLPEIGIYVLVYNTEGATLIGKRLNDGWIALFADGVNDMGDLVPIYWAYINEPK